MQGKASNIRHYREGISLVSKKPKRPEGRRIKNSKNMTDGRQDYIIEDMNDELSDIPVLNMGNWSI